MLNWIRSLGQKKSRSPRRPAMPRERLSLEALEDRLVPTVTWHYTPNALGLWQHGPVLSNVEVQAVYFGSDWNSAQYTGYNRINLDSFLAYLVQSPYMDMLTTAGYKVGRGSTTGGVVDTAIDSVILDKSQPLADSAIETELWNEIQKGYLAPPDANRLYVIYVEPNVIVADSGFPYPETSEKDFLGYHDYFVSSTNATIRYAVIPYAGGKNTIVPTMTAFDSMTATTSHEIAEAVTDPNMNAWYDDSIKDNHGTPEEIGDIAQNQFNNHDGNDTFPDYVYLNGYAVQRMADQADQPMTPQGATARTPVSFVLSSGTVYMISGASTYLVASGVTSISDQGIDVLGRAMISAVGAQGGAIEIHEDFNDPNNSRVFQTRIVVDSAATSVLVQSAKAGQGVSYVQFRNGTVYEYYNDGSQPRQVNAGWGPMTGIDAGTNSLGVNMVVMISNDSNRYGWEFIDGDATQNLGFAINTLSAGRQGISGIVNSVGGGYYWNDANRSLTFVASGVAQLTAGFDAAGKTMLEMRYTNGDLYEYRNNSWYYIWSGVLSVSKARAGVVGIVFSFGGYTHDSAGWHYLMANATNVV